MTVAAVGRSMVPAAAFLGAGGIVASVLGWRSAKTSGRPADLAVAGVLVGVAVTVIVILLAL